MGESRKRILVVDDSEELREFCRLVLEGAGYEVDTACSGLEAFDMVKASRPDLIVLDLIMPGMDGLELLTQLRSDLAPPIPPTILCSGFDLTEEEALRRGALMFVRKPVAPADLREFVAAGLLGRRVSAEMSARERANSAAARSRVRRTASAFVAGLQHEIQQRTASHMAWLAGYFGVQTAVIALMDDGRLTAFAVSGETSFTVGLDVSNRLPPCHEILESRSSLVLADASSHACFRAGPYRLDGIGFFAGVPLLSPGKDPIGVICIFDPTPRITQAEDLLILEQMGRQGSLLMELLSLGRPDAELPGRFGGGMVLRPSLELLVDAELRLLGRQGGSMELAVVEVDDPSVVREAVIGSSSPERLAAGALGPTRVAVYKRHPAGGAAREVQAIITIAESKVPIHAIGSAAIEGAALPRIGGNELVRLAELELERALSTDGGRSRLVMQHDDPSSLVHARAS